MSATKRPAAESGPVPRARIPDLADAIWAFRRALEISRATAYRRHGISPSYLSQIEKGERIPSPEMVEQLVTGYALNRAQAQYLHDLRAPSLCLEPTSHARRRIFENKRLVQHLEELERRGVLAAFVDPLKQVLATNHIFRSGLPGLHEAGSIPLWMFSNVGQETVIDWPREAHRAVASLRPALARYRDTEQARTLIAKITKHATFNDIWHHSTDVSYSRETTDPLHWYNPDTNQPASLTLGTSAVTENHSILLITAVPRAYCGPSDYLSRLPHRPAAAS